MAIAAVRVHTYYAEAHAVGKREKGSPDGCLEAQGQIFLDPDGGKRVAKISVDLDGIRVNSATMEVIGGQANNGWATTAVAVLEGVNVREKLTADRIVGFVSTQHPAEGYVPSLTFQDAGSTFGMTRFENLQVFGQKVDLGYNLSVCGQTPGEMPNKNPEAEPYLEEYLSSEEFLRNARAQDLAIADSETAPDWAQKRFRRNPGRCAIEASLVTNIAGVPSGVRSAGHVMDIPDLGRIFLAELIVGEHFDLTMIRMELADGEFTIGGPGTNGRTRP